MAKNKDDKVLERETGSAYEDSLNNQLGTGAVTDNGAAGSKNRVMDKWARPSADAFLGKNPAVDPSGKSGLYGMTPEKNRLPAEQETAGGGYGGGGSSDPTVPTGPSPEDDAAAIQARTAALQQLIGNMPDRVPFSYAEAPKYVSNWQDQINQMANEILGRQPFSYNALEDPFYHQYRESYTRGGQQAMRDTMGQAAGLTGGYGSTYAQGVGQQTYNRYMQDLADKVPELEQLAYDRWLNEGNQMQQRMNMLQNLENSDYGRYADELGQWNADRSFDYGQYADDRDWAYQTERDRVADARYLDSLAYDRAKDRAATMAAYGDFSDLEAMGYTPTQIAMLRTAYEAAQQGGGGGYRSPAEEETVQQNDMLSQLALGRQPASAQTVARSARTAFADAASKAKADVSKSGSVSPAVQENVSPAVQENRKKEIEGVVKTLSSQGIEPRIALDEAVSSGLITEKEAREMEKGLSLDMWR